MSYKVSLILSMIFVSLFFLFGADMISVQFIYSELDAKSTSISYLISKNMSVSQQYIDTLEQQFNVTFVSYTKDNVTFGDTFSYVIGYPFDPIIISNETMMIEVSRTTVIGYYN